MNIMMKIMNRLLPSCREVSHLTSQAMDESLTLRKRVLLQLHIKMCIWCQRNQEQLMQIKDMASKQAKEINKNTNLSDEAKKRISRLIQNKK